MVLFDPCSRPHFVGKGWLLLEAIGNEACFYSVSHNTMVLDL
jgi:hypothetical protein